MTAMSAVSPVPPLHADFFYAVHYWFLCKSDHQVFFISLRVYFNYGVLLYWKHNSLAVWLMTSLQKYCKYVVFKMFNPKKLYLDLNFMTFREQKGKYWHGEK